MSITAKVFCSSKTVYKGGNGGAQFKFAVDYQDGRNKEWAQATPTLSLDMSVNREDMFEVGKSYTLTFTPDGG